MKSIHQITRDLAFTIIIATISILIWTPIALGQTGSPCGPPVTRQASTRLKEAVQIIQQSSSSASVSAPVPIPDAPGLFDLSLKAKSSNNTANKITQDDAWLVIEQYLHTSDSILIAECGYRACLLAQQHAPSPAYDIVASICSGERRRITTHLPQVRAINPTTEITIGPNTGKIVTASYFIWNQNGISVEADRVLSSISEPNLRPRLTQSNGRLILQPGSTTTLAVEISVPQLSQFQDRVATFELTIPQPGGPKLRVPLQAILRSQSPPIPSWTCKPPIVDLAADCEKGRLGEINSSGGLQQYVGWKNSYVGPFAFCQHDSPNEGRSFTQSSCDKTGDEVSLYISNLISLHGGYTKSGDSTLR